MAACCLFYSICVIPLELSLWNDLGPCTPTPTLDSDMPVDLFFMARTPSHRSRSYPGSHVQAATALRALPCRTLSHVPAPSRTRSRVHALSPCLGLYVWSSASACAAGASACVSNFCAAGSARWWSASSSASTSTAATATRSTHTHAHTQTSSTHGHTHAYARSRSHTHESTRARVHVILNIGRCRRVRERAGGRGHRQRRTRTRKRRRTRAGAGARRRTTTPPESHSASRPCHRIALPCPCHVHIAKKNSRPWPVRVCHVPPPLAAPSSRPPGRSRGWPGRLFDTVTSRSSC